MTGMFSITIGAWQPAIGDPSFMGWFTVFSYYLVAALCLFKVLLHRQPMEKNTRTFWIFLCCMMVFLGLQKQFNLLTALTEIGRMIARSGGWAEQRRPVQALAMVAAGIAGLIIFRAAYHRLSAVSSGVNKIAFIGLVYLLLFVVLRAISLHQFGTVLNYEICGARVNWIAELLGIYWIGLAVFRPHRTADGR